MKCCVLPSSWTKIERHVLPTQRNCATWRKNIDKNTFRFGKIRVRKSRLPSSLAFLLMALDRAVSELNWTIRSLSWLFVSFSVSWSELAWSNDLESLTRNVFLRNSLIRRPFLGCCDTKAEALRRCRDGVARAVTLFESVKLAADILPEAWKTELLVTNLA